MKKSIAAAALFAVAACSAPGGSSSFAPTRTDFSQVRGAMQPENAEILSRIVGVGDSLTAGYQAGGFLGDPNMKNPFYPGTNVPPGQEEGWWADLVEQASGEPLQLAILSMFDPAHSPLPLIKAPGLDNQIVPDNTTKITLLKPGNSCSAYGGFDAAAFVLSGLNRVRMNPGSTTVRDLGVPGITLHEANVLSMPQTNTCEALPGVPGLLSQVVSGESGTYWPVLGNFAHLGSQLSEANAAASLKPTLATVWLGANDILKFMGSGGRFVGGDRTAAQARADVIATVRTLQKVRARVVVANLPDIPLIPYLMRADIPQNKIRDCKINAYFFCTLKRFGFSGFAAQNLANAVAAQYHLVPSYQCKAGSVNKPCGYVTLQGALAVLTYFLTHSGQLPNLDANGPGSGQGTYYIQPALAGQIQEINNQLNEGIAQAAKATDVPLVDVKKIFEGIASGDPNNPYFKQAVSINHNVCCTLTYLGGLVSFDGAHPSNTGYALIAYHFIETINKRYHTKIPQIDIVAAYNGSRCAVVCFKDPYAPPFPSSSSPVNGGDWARFLPVTPR